MTDDQDSQRPPPDPGYGSVRDFLLYSLSIPERTLRSATSVVGGTLRESAVLLVPQAFQSSKTYSIFVTQMLDFLVEDVGGVERADEDGKSTKVENFVARKDGWKLRGDCRIGHAPHVTNDRPGNRQRRGIRLSSLSEGAGNRVETGRGDRRRINHRETRRLLRSRFDRQWHDRLGLRHAAPLRRGVEANH